MLIKIKIVPSRKLLLYINQQIWIKREGGCCKYNWVYDRAEKSEFVGNYWIFEFSEKLPNFRKQLISLIGKGLSKLLLSQKVLNESSFIR